MKQVFLDKLLAIELGWNEEEVEKNREYLSDFAELKYDSYQQYVPGSQFMENLLLWLRGFKNEEDKKTMYGFFKDNLVYVSPAEMFQFVSTVYLDKIWPHFLKQAERHNAVVNKGCSISEIAKILQGRSIFLPLSDGARLGNVRRHSQLDNEQVAATYKLSEKEISEMVEQAKKRIEQFPEYEERKELWELEDLSQPISYVFLLDDFSGSGISYLRHENGSSEQSGKFCRVVEYLEKGGIDTSKVEFILLIYLAGDAAEKYLIGELNKYFKYDVSRFSVSVMQPIPTADINDDVERILREQYEASTKGFEDLHFKKGSTARPYLGFNGGQYPLVIYHNTPNNSITTFWYSDKTMSALFPSVTRHKE